eukprot:CAMPEP_0196806510 /NCGR_PEP_ID=MMETSP1362-20130617/6410_1 /TAXON_ID=163516 /ORGANISM="Leptocylindrus danicus, Strain CCMP1856" /LENGTH=181 /DNA_ID=CAMNT_0042180011 /DNA_START=785 /DNA_END=1331 /DNA_ORIENTATION=+
MAKQSVVKILERMAAGNDWHRFFQFSLSISQDRLVEGAISCFDDLVIFFQIMVGWAEGKEPISVLKVARRQVVGCCQQFMVCPVLKLGGGDDWWLVLGQMVRFLDAVVAVGFAIYLLNSSTKAWTAASPALNMTLLQKSLVGGTTRKSGYLCRPKSISALRTRHLFLDKVVWPLVLVAVER